MGAASGVRQALHVKESRVSAVIHTPSWRVIVSSDNRGEGRRPRHVRECRAVVARLRTAPGKRRQAAAFGAKTRLFGAGKDL